MTDEQKLDRIEQSIASLTEVVTDLRIQVREVVTQAKFSACPAPGTCVGLSERVAKLADTVEKLAEARQQAIGERTIIVAASVFLGGILQAVVVFLLKAKGS